MRMATKSSLGGKAVKSQVYVQTKPSNFPKMMRISPKWSNVLRKCCTSCEYILSYITMMCGPSRADLTFKWLAACSVFHFEAWALISLSFAMCLVNVFASIIAAKFGACKCYDVRLMNKDGAPPESRQYFLWNYATQLKRKLIETFGIYWGISSWSAATLR